MMAAAVHPPRASSRQSNRNAAGAPPPLPDFETLLASKGSTIRVRASEDRQRHSRDGDSDDVDDDNEELLEQETQVPPTPPRKAGREAAGKNSSNTMTSSNGIVRGREAALRDIEREMALDEVDEDEDGFYGGPSDDDENQQEGSSNGVNQRQSQDRLRSGAAADTSISNTAVNGNSQHMAGSAPLPTSSDKALPLSPPDLLEQDLRRRSQYRTPGIATSPDLATLVKAAKASSNGQLASLPPAQQTGHITSTSATSSQGGHSVSPVMTLRGPGSPRSRVSSDSGSRRPPPVMTTVSSLQAAMDSPRARAVSTRSDSATSFVHVNSSNGPIRMSSLTHLPSTNGVPPTPSTLFTIPDSDLGTVTSVWSGGAAGSAATTRRSKKLTKGGGEENVSIITSIS